MPASKNTPRIRSKDRRTHVNYPGRLATVISERIIELERGTFSIYAIELVCYDLRKRRNHSITGPLFQKSLEVQDAIDRQVVRNYRPFTRRRGEFIESLVNDTLLNYVAPDSSDGLVSKEAEWVLSHRSCARSSGSAGANLASAASRNTSLA